jgi:CRISPR-associated protein Cmr5
VTEPLYLGERKRAQHCLNTIQKRREQYRYDYNLLGKYAKFARELPLAIIRSGLGQSIARINSSGGATKSKGKRDMLAYQLLYQDLSSWLVRNEPDAPYPYPERFDLLQAIMVGDRNQYRLATAEAIAWLTLHYQLGDVYFRRRKEEANESGKRS